MRDQLRKRRGDRAQKSGLLSLFPGYRPQGNRGLNASTGPVVVHCYILSRFNDAQQAPIRGNRFLHDPARSK